MELQGVIFDLDGVITDTAEYHYRAWQRLADEEGLAFDRQVNEQLRGVSRRASLEIILKHAGVTLDEPGIAERMERKNRYYVDMLDEITPRDLLPGARELIEELRANGVKVAIGSASKNTPTVLDRLGIRDLMDAVADGNNVQEPKPAPDVFLKAAELLGVPPAFCAVIEDAAAGVDAALNAKMWAVGVGPEERVGHAHARFECLEGVTLAALRAALENAAWTVREAVFDPTSQRHMETVFTTGNGVMCAGRVRGRIPRRHARVLHAPRLGRHARQLHRAGESAGMVGHRSGGQRRAIPSGPRPAAEIPPKPGSADRRSSAQRALPGGGRRGAGPDLRTLHQHGGPAPRSCPARGASYSKARPTSG